MATGDEAARELGELYRELYRYLHRRRGPGDACFTPQSFGLLEHLSLSGPLTIGEMGKHLGRAQSVVSEMVDALEGRGLLERVTDPRDRRRSLVWLTESAREALQREREVLDREHCRRALQSLSLESRRGLLEGLRALVEAARAPRRAPTLEPTGGESRPRKKRSTRS